MDRERFDALARLLATTGSRRATLAALLGAGLLGQRPDVLAKPGQGQGENKHKDRKRRKKRGRTGNDGGQSPEPAPEPCCGTKRCADPEHGGARSDCDFGGRSFAGQDLNGSTFRGIDGSGATFDDANLGGSVFAEACLQGAAFRGAKLGGSTWGDACLAGTDFTGADLGRDADALDGALLCATVMPDGTVNDRDCGRATACCNPGASPGPAPQCANPGPSKNLNGCDFAGKDFSGQDLSSSSISDATFRNAELVAADLSDSTMRRSNFRGANLCSANLSSSALNQADFRGSTGPDGRPTNLTRANLQDSGCGGVQFNDQTIFCQTITCNGVVRNDDCPAGVDPEDVCCTDADCGPARICRNHACVPDPGTCTAGQNICQSPGGSSCGDQPRCRCHVTTSAERFCGSATRCSDCSADEDCDAVTGPGSVCADFTGPLCSCRETNSRACVGPCGAPCTRNGQCGDNGVCCDGACQSGDCCDTADCGANETCEANICVCPGCRSRINNRCEVGDAWAQCGADGARCAECAEGQVCAAGAQTCASCEFGFITRGTYCEIRENVARHRCGANCACAAGSPALGACFNVGATAYCSTGSEPVCEFAADCVIEGLGDDCILAGECEPGCNKTVCVTRCGRGDDEGPPQLVVLD